MKLLEFSSSLAEISDRYPSVEQLLRVMTDGDGADLNAIARQWLSEGIPFAFKECPAVYESLRSWLSERLDVEAKAVSMTGSGRLGSSLSTRKGKLGKPFSPDSDLDLFVVSEELFQSMCHDFCRWSSDFRNGDVSPISNNENKKWLNNVDEGPTNIGNGFINSWRVPNNEVYGVFRNIYLTLSELLRDINASKLAPSFSKASLRCYKSWRSFERQITINLMAAADSSRT